MPDTLELDSTWTVALSNIIYPFSFSLLDDSETNETESITVFRTYKDEVRSTRIEIPDLFFSSEAALESALNSFLLDVWEKELEKIRLEEENEEAKKRIYGGFFRRRRDADNTEVTEYGYPPEYQKKLLDLNKIQLSDPRYQWVSVHHDLTHNRFWFWFQGNVKYIQLSKQLAYTLGFESQTIYSGHVAKYMPDISGGVRQLLVYAPKLVENSIIGNVTAPLLRVVNVSGKPGDSVSEVYMTEHHHRLQGKRHPDITIEIRTLTGKLVKFHWGNCIITLHFQRSLF
uniref:Uncharacterized protein n=1 Tax=Meloidogyne enterolobii TaxID=390850 RepID=A0A6V7XMU3_MELEN|nr:unnamed protein product [Meloidogyne enterolobii]